MLIIQIYGSSQRNSQAKAVSCKGLAKRIYNFVVVVEIIIKIINRMITYYLQKN